MSLFQADFSYFPDVIFAPAKIEFNNKSSIGTPSNDEFTFAVDREGNHYTPTNDITSYVVNRIEKYSWDFTDGEISSEISPVKVFNFAGVYPVKLEIYSSEIFDIETGVFFRIKNVVTKNVDVGSMTYAWLKQHMTQPHLQALDQGAGFNDLISATSKMFDRMYKDIHEVASLMDVKHVAPKFLEFFSDTLNHQRFYAEKVGYAEQLDNDLKQLFFDYNIFERITKDTAGEEEIEAFRQFILDTAALFKQNGSQEAMEKFFKLYNFMVHIKEMWTTNFGTTAVGAIRDDFFLDPTLENTKSKFKFKGISVTGYDNSLAQFSNSFNNLLIDNYHFVSRHTYPDDATANPDCSLSFEINDYPPHINKIFREDGRLLFDKSDCGTFDIETPCASAEPEITCTEDNVILEPNPDWSINENIISGVSYKFWNAPDGYVQSVINTVGTIPHGVDEIDETPEFGDTSDDYLWADWKAGVTKPATIVGVGSLIRPNYVANYPAVNFSTTATNDNLVQVPGIPIETKHDFFVVARGFIKISKEAFYNFSVDVGNVGGGDTTQHVALFSLKHKTTYTLNDLDKIKSLNDITFLRDGTTNTMTVGTTATGQVNIYSKNGEYGIIEVRQNEPMEASDSYYLTEGYYAFELKTTYNSFDTKKMKLYWEAYVVVEEPTSLHFTNVLDIGPIPSHALFTIDQKLDVIDNNEGKGLMTIPNSLIEGADIITVSYSESNGMKGAVSGIISRDKQFKDLELNVRFSPVAIPSWQDLNNRSTPQRTLMTVFRAVSRGKDLYADVDNYYAVILDGNHGTISLAHVSYSTEIDGPYFRYLNLNPNLNQKDKLIFENEITDENGQLVKLEDGIYYDLKVNVANDKVTVSFRLNSQFTESVDKIHKSISQDLAGYADSDTYKVIINGVTLIQDDADTDTRDANGNSIVIAEKYVPIDQVGFYGLALKSSVFKINHYEVIPIDKTDNNRLETVDKWKQIKPKFLDSRNHNLLQYNSYEATGIDKPTSPTFNIAVSEEYTGETNVFPLPSTVGQIDINTVNKVLADNVTVDEWGTRFNVWINKDFINDRFTTMEEVMDSILVPYGNMFEPFVNWSRVEASSASYTKSEQAGFTPFISESAHVLPHTISLSGDVTEYASQLSRASDNSSILELNTVLKDFLEATTHSEYLGFWEEVCPYSASPTWSISNQSVNNQVFEIIYRDTTTKDEVIGVRVLNDNAYDRLIGRYCQDEVLWGLYDITLPVYSTEKQPLYVTHSPTKVTTIRYFVPIGKLNKEFVFMLPPPEIMRSGVVGINLIGVYAHHSFEGFELISPSKTKFTITVPNPWEGDFKSKIQCNYFLDIRTSFVDKFTKNNIPLNPSESTPCEPGNQLERDPNDAASVLPNTFYMPTQIANLFAYLEKNSDDFVGRYNYWVPKNLWIKRKFSTVYPDNTNESVFSGLNSPNAFYSKDALTGEQGTHISLQDKFDADLGKYIADVSWCATSVGWDAEFATKENNTYDVGIFSDSVYSKIGFDTSTKFVMGTEKLIPLGNYLSAPVPLDTVSTTASNKNLKFGSYLDGEHGPGRSFMPVGLFNWFLTHANEIDDTSNIQRIGWDITELNDQFVQCVKFNAVYGEVSPAFFKINKYWAFYPDQIPPFGSVVKIARVGGNCAAEDGDDAPITQEVDITLGVSDGLSAFYSVPPLVEFFPKWLEQVSRVFVDQYEIPSEQYTVRVNTATHVSELVLNNQLYDFSKFIGPTEFVVSFFFDKLFKLTDSKKLVDDFDLHRELNWITFVEENDHYKIATRLPETELKYTANTLPYSIVEYKNSNVFKLVDKFDNVNPSQFSGVSDKGTTVGIIGNHGSINSMQLTDIESSNYSISCDVIFDKDIVNTDFDKRFELILKAENNFVRDEEEWGITDFYFVGFGTYGFDIGLGMRSIDENGELKETFLASFGDFNVRKINADTWYTISATVTNTDIKIYFNEKSKDPELVIDYVINKKYEKYPERYLKGEFETLQAVIIGLQELGITYPDKLGNVVSSEYTFENFKAEFAATLPVNGYYTGFRVFNPMTYVTNIVYTAELPKQYTYGSTFDVFSYNNFIHAINSRFGLPASPEIKKITQTLNFTTFIQINDSLFYQVRDTAPEKYSRPVVDFYTIDDKIIIIEKENPENSAVGLNDWSVGDHVFTWSLSDNTQNITSMQDFFASVPNLTQVKLTRDAVDYVAGLTVGTSGISGDNIVLALSDVITVTIGGDRNVIWPLGGTLGLYNIFVRVFQEGFTHEYPILIKDKTFYKDGLKSYMNFADKKIKEVVINDNKMNIIFEDN